MSHKINDGLTPQQRWRKRHPERSRAAVAKCRLLHLEQYRESGRKSALKYAAEHREQERIRAAQWRKYNPEKSRQGDRVQYLKDRNAVMEYNRKYREENPERVTIWRRNRRGRKRSGAGRITRRFVLSLFSSQNGKCIACHVDFAKTGYDIDHIIPLSKGGEHSEMNIQLLCPTCNKRKFNRTMEQFLSLLEAENA